MSKIPPIDPKTLEMFEYVGLTPEAIESCAQAVQTICDAYPGPSEDPEDVFSAIPGIGRALAEVLGPDPSRNKQLLAWQMVMAFSMMFVFRERCRHCFEYVFKFDALNRDPQIRAAFKDSARHVFDRMMAELFKGAEQA